MRPDRIPPCFLGKTGASSAAFKSSNGVLPGCGTPALAFEFGQAPAVGALFLFKAILRSGGMARYPHPAADAVKVAEQRFRRELDRQLSHDVVPALRAFQNASESGESDLTKDEVMLAKRWIKAFDVARTAGFRDLGDTDEAYFAVRAV